MKVRFQSLLNRVSLLGFLTLFVSAPVYANDFEPRLIDSLNSLQYQPSEVTESKISSLIEDYPNSQTAHLLMADLLVAKAGVIDTEKVRQSYQESTTLQQLDGLRDEVRLRWNQSTLSSPARSGLVPASIIQLAPNRNSIVVVDAQNARIYTYRNEAGKLALVMDNYASIGERGIHKRVEGDERTPIGVYYVTRYIDDKDLPPLYGTGAFPINYPNEIDRHYGRTGYGIWLHGTHPESFNRVPLASDGCVAMSNPEFDSLKPLIEPANKTSVIISERINWIKPENLREKRSYFQALLKNWVKDWESLDSDAYLSHYDKEKFFTRDHNYHSWANHKRNINARKSKIDIELGDISLFLYPGEKDLLVAEFIQNYHSNNFDSEAGKRQYWRRNAQGEWKIIYEGRQ